MRSREESGLNKESQVAKLPLLENGVDAVAQHNDVENYPKRIA
jgi:hypothetical protein